MSEKSVRPRRPLPTSRTSVHASVAPRLLPQRPVNSDRPSWSKTTTPLYRPLRYVGRGSFGVVLLAEEVNTGAKVAIKRVHHDARLHNREVFILNSILVDNPRHKKSPSTAVDSNDASRTPGGTTRASLTPSSTLSSSHTVEDVHLWPGTHHPNIVELLDFYVTYDTGSPEQALGVDMGGAVGAAANFEFLPSHPATAHRCPLGGGRGAAPGSALPVTAPLSACAYLEMVMSYLPMDLCYVKKYYFCFHDMPTMGASSSASPLSSPEKAARELSSGELLEGSVDCLPTSPKHARTGCKTNSSSRHSSIGSSCDTCSHLPLRWVKVILFQLARALAFMHVRQVCHRDLKPANVLVDPDTGRVQVCDFGSAKQITRPTEEKNVSYICSRYYRAPELLFGALHYGCAVDMWSFGCIAAELLRESGKPLFRGSTSIDQMAELFKVLGAPSKREMYAMNPQCAEALLRTHAMHRHQRLDNGPHSVSGGGGRRDRACGLELEAHYEAEEEDDVALRDSAPPGGYDVDSHGGFLRDALDDGISSQASVSPGIAMASPPSSSTKESQDCKTRFSAPASTPATATLDDVAPTPFEEYYDVLKVRAIPWRKLFPVDTPTEAVALVASLLCYAPEKRLTAAELVEHPFFDDLFSVADAQPESAGDSGTAASMASGVKVCPEDDGVESAALQLPNGRLLPLSMFQVTEVERGLYTDVFLARMARQAELVAAAMSREESQ
ncbi:protein kinase, putative [Leishmania tarentolae]|uniref:Protein kinase, putative n=1 Tax=Leishmania tarentolae TaxID=5689 RepID=A0A640KGT4_LEITA|nr:protein kinase, putative [Leishmania tarentolae]